MAARSRTALLTPRSIAVLLGLACLAALVAAAVGASGSSAANPFADGALPNPVGVGFLLLGLLALAAGAALRIRRTVVRPSTPTSNQPLTAAEIRLLLDRWYPDWEPRHRRRVAAVIDYHRRGGDRDD